MGYGSTNTGAPASCFNAQKHYKLGWFDARGGARRLDLDELPWHGYLAFFGDYHLTDWNEPVVISIGSAKARFYLQYNRARGINRETRMFANSVAIVKDGESTGKHSAAKLSWQPQAFDSSLRDSTGAT